MPDASGTTRRALRTASRRVASRAAAACEFRDPTGGIARLNCCTARERTGAASTAGQQAASWESCSQARRFSQGKATSTSWSRCVLAERTWLCASCVRAAQTVGVQVQEVLGTPTDAERAWLRQHPEYDAAPLPRALRAVPLEMALPDADSLSVQLVARLLRYAAPERISASAALCDAWFMRLPLPLPRRDVLQLFRS